ncbi:MAG: 2Fe-2S iron-sulfur cluster-binding protein [Cyanobium sp.]
MAETNCTRIHWPNGTISKVAAGTDWLEAAQAAQVLIPTGCLGGSCGACEITVNGDTLRACLAVVPSCDGGELTVEIWSDPTW